MLTCSQYVSVHISSLALSSTSFSLPVLEGKNKDLFSGSFFLESVAVKSKRGGGGVKGRRGGHAA